MLRPSEMALTHPARAPSLRRLPRCWSLPRSRSSRTFTTANLRNVDARSATHFAPRKHCCLRHCCLRFCDSKQFCQRHAVRDTSAHHPPSLTRSCVTGASETSAHGRASLRDLQKRFQTNLASTPRAAVILCTPAWCVSIVTKGVRRRRSARSSLRALASAAQRAAIQLRRARLPQPRRSAFLRASAMSLAAAVPGSLRKNRDVRVCVAASRGLDRRCCNAASGARRLGFSSL